MQETPFTRLAKQVGRFIPLQHCVACLGTGMSPFTYRDCTACVGSGLSVALRGSRR